jgi:hypothetical protein
MDHPVTLPSLVKQLLHDVEEGRAAVFEATDVKFDFDGSASEATLRVKRFRGLGVTDDPPSAGS